MTSKNNPYFPLIYALILGVGVYIGSLLNYQPFRDVEIREDANKITDIVKYIEENYVDSVDRQKLIDKTIAQMLAELDPHSSYITKEELKAMNEPLEGKFGGVGIRFLIHKDTLSVTHVVEGSPSEKVGIVPGDRIIEINDSLVTDGKLTNEDVLTLLKGDPGTSVVVTIYRSGKKYKKVLVRGTIPIPSIDVSMMLDDKTGFIKLTRFSATSYEEFKDAVTGLKSKGMERLIFDLRNNSGGYLTAAIDIVDEFLHSGKLIVYTEGLNSPRSSSYSTAKGSLKDMEAIILINRGSASASEIVAGALQDNDRGIILGRRSFGKGLVQNQENLKDGSAIRLTVSRYYTPTGRSIQRPYGDGIEYYDEYMDRFAKGELLHRDSIKINDSIVFTTPKGKKVYGGGGIVPDIFVPEDTSGYSHYYNMLFYFDAFSHFTFDFANARRNSFSDLKEYLDQFMITEKIFSDFISYSDSLGLQPVIEEINLSKNVIKQRLKAEIAQHIWGDIGFYLVTVNYDTDVKEALNIFKSKKISAL